MSRRAKTIIRYDGPALSGHEMDVHKLAPALLAVGELCRVANQTFNADVATVKVLVKANVEQQCFQLQLELVQTLFETLSVLLDDEKIQNA